MKSLDNEPGHYNPTAGEFQPLTLVVPATMAGRRLDQALAALLPDFSRSRLAAWVREERVRVEGRAATPSQSVWGGERLDVLPAPAPDAGAFTPEPLPLAVAHEDAAVLVIDKPAGLVVHPGSGNWHGTLLNGLLHRYPDLGGVPRAGIVHRLDKDTTGLMVVARTLAAQTDLVRQMQARSVRREYLAVVHGRLAAGGTVDAPVGRHPRDRVRMAVVADGREAVTHYEVVETFAQHTLVRCRLETGRTHQIRVHMQSIGHPLAGDPVYGGPAGRRSGAAGQVIAALQRQALHAVRLAFIHPATGEPVAFESALPGDLADLLATLRCGHGERN